MCLILNFKCLFFILTPQKCEDYQYLYQAIKQQAILQCAATKTYLVVFSPLLKIIFLLSYSISKLKTKLHLKALSDIQEPVRQNFTIKIQTIILQSCTLLTKKKRHALL